MNNKILLVFVLIASIFSFNKVFAQDTCSKEGYTILTINGIFTDEKGAIENKDKLKDRFLLPYKNEPINVDYLYNATHFAGALDLVDVVRQGLLDSKSDYDLVEMLNSASKKIKTQKLLLVGHSQGNFYANDFYDKVVNTEGGVPAQSIGMYSVATPDTYVSGGGKYITSDTDTVISAVVGRLKNIMTPNTHINLKKEDGNGHSFSDVYLKYRSGTIVSDIKSSFDKLKNNTIQKTENPCISTQKISLAHKVSGNIIKAGDFVVNKGVKASNFVFNSVKNTVTTLTGTLVNVAKKSFALVGLVDDNTNQNDTASTTINDSTADDISNADLESTEVKDPEEKTNENIEPEIQIEEKIISLGKEDDSLEEDKKTEEKTTTTSITSSSNNGGGGTTTPETDSLDKKIEPDITPPVITLNGESNISLQINEIYKEEGATATDDIDGSLTVLITGDIDNKKIGTNTITYTAKDKALNTTILTRTINIIKSNSVDSKTSTLIFPRSGIFKDDGLDIELGKKDTTVLTFQVIYRDAENNPPPSLKLHFKNHFEGFDLPPVDMVKIPNDTDELSDGDYENGELFTYSSTFDTGYYLYSIKLIDKDGNFFNINEDGSRLRFNITPYDNFYIPKYTFGNQNGDGNYWQVWIFNGSNVYDWNDTYVNNYLHEQFKIETYPGGFWCSDCLQRGIFPRNPQNGFDNNQVITSQLEGSPQNNSSGNTYDVDIQWDSSGYTTTIYNGSVVYSSSHTDIANVNTDMWVGWDGSLNGFKKFPSGNWIGFWARSEKGLMGGQDMIITPYPVYKGNTEDPKIIQSSERFITSFSFSGLEPKVDAVINNTDNTINITVPNATDIKNITPTILISDKAKINNLEIKDFTNPVEYTVTAEDGSISVYTVNVLVSTEIIVKKSSEKLIKVFRINNLTPEAIVKNIDNENRTISIEVPYGLNITSLSATVTVSDKATVSPDYGKYFDFTNPVEYTVTAEDGSTAVYTATITASQPPQNDTIPPYIVTHSIDGLHGGINSNPIRSNTKIVIYASENVNWMSIKIEKADNPSIYKIFQSDSTGCKDGTNTCSKSWNGDLSSGGLLQNGDYGIRVHMQDLSNNDANKYISGTIGVIGQDI